MTSGRANQMPNPTVTLITGAANGIGRATAEALHADGHHVVLVDVDEEAGAEVAARLENSTFLACDVSDSQQIDATVRLAVEIGGGHLCGLVNNAGRTARVSVDDLDEVTWRSLQSINLDSVYRFTRACLPALRAGGGAIVNTASVAGLVGEEGLAGYSATKGAIIAWTKSLALELRGVRVNAVCPGQINTRLMARVTGNPELMAATTGRIPQGRLGEPSEVADVIAWLLSPRSSFVNGVAIAVDGGETAGIKA
jgi:NAD(P)-dependent dehydrogenase (short-subunit alcohol dehydrogenase family)